MGQQLKGLARSTNPVYQYQLGLDDYVLNRISKLLNPLQFGDIFAYSGRNSIDLSHADVLALCHTVTLKRWSFRLGLGVHDIIFSRKLPHGSLWLETGFNGWHGYVRSTSQYRDGLLQADDCRACGCFYALFSRFQTSITPDIDTKLCHTTSV